MRLLLLGGSWFLGRLIIEDLVRQGWDVTVFNGGRSTVPLPAGVRHVCGDRTRDNDLRMLAGSGPWDVVVDVSGKVPAVVRRSVRALATVAERYVSVSTVQVYRDWPHAAVDEDSPLRPGDPGCDPGTRAWSPADYGRLKVGCELACRERFGDDRLLVLRLHAMIGQYEYVDPLRWWLGRMRCGGPILVPASNHSIQAIDARDVARFLVDQVQRGTLGIFNVGAPTESRTYSALLRACADAVAAEALAPPELVWADEGWLVEQGGVREWTELPLWRHGAGERKVSVDRALAAGLRCRPLPVTIADTWRWLKRNGWLADHKSADYGMHPEREAAIIARWRAEAAGPPAEMPAAACTISSGSADEAAERPTAHANDS